LGGALGVLLATWGAEMIASGMPAAITRFIPGWDRMVIDGEVLAFTLAVSVLSGVLFGLAPALSLAGPQLRETLHDGARGSAAPGQRRMLASLVVSEIALALILLTGAGLMARGFTGLTRSLKSGIDTGDVLSIQVALPDARYGEQDQIRSF